MPNHQNRGIWLYQTVSIAGETFSFRKGETIHTENSYKYSVQDVRAMGEKANLRLDKTWFDRQRYFLVGLFRPMV